MKKRTAIILFGSLLMSVGCYVGVCLRVFYLAPRLEVDGSVSPEGRAAAVAWAKTFGYPERDRFEWSAAFVYLCRPWHAWAESSVVVREDADTGLWATYRYRIWSLTKPTAGKAGQLESVIVHDRGFVPVETVRAYHSLELAAAGIESLIAGEGTIEILSLEPQIVQRTHLDKPRQARNHPHNVSEDFHQYRILGRAMIEEDEVRKHLLGTFAASIRDAEVHVDFLCFNPRHGIIHNHGDERTEYLICFECAQVKVFESTGRESGISVSRHGGEPYAAYLDQHGIEQDRPEH